MCSGAAARFASAQEAPVAAGMRIRITTAPSNDQAGKQRRTLVGSLVTIDESTVVVTDQHGSNVRVLRTFIIAMERSAGRKSRGKNTAIGLLVGATVGAAMVAATASDCTGLCVVGPGAAAVVGGIFFGDIGAAIGAVVPPAERWTRVPLPSP